MKRYKITKIKISGGKIKKARKSKEIKKERKEKEKKNEKAKEEERMEGRRNENKEYFKECLKKRKPRGNNDDKFIMKEKKNG